jgi:toxin ParE1/3/4
MQILWLDRAQSDLRELFQYLVQHNPNAGRRSSVAVETEVLRLADYPALGRPGRVAGTRELIIPGTPYLVAYTVDPRARSVIVLRVLHGRREWPESLGD